MTEVPRDLACAEYWEESLARSHRRREAAERQLNFGPIDSKRIAVPAALLAGGSAVAGVVTSGASGGGGGDATAAVGASEANQVDASASDSLPTKAVKAEKPAEKRSAGPKARSAGPKGRSAAKRSPKKKPVVVQTVSQAQQLGGFKKGMRGPGVIQLQRKLGVTADGIYGPTTLKAVHRAQKRGDLNTDGIVGPATWRVLSSPS